MSDENPYAQFVSAPAEENPYAQFVAPAQKHRPQSLDLDEKGNIVGASGSPAAIAQRSPLLPNEVKGADLLTQLGTERSLGMKYGMGIHRFGTSLAHGAEQLYDMAADKLNPRQQNLSGLVTGQAPQTRLQADQAQEADDRKTYQDLDSDPAALAGRITGNVAALALPGAGAARGLEALGAAPSLIGRAGAVAAEHPWLAAIPSGAAQGFAAPTAGDGERGWNTALGAVAAPAGAVAASGLSTLARTGSSGLSKGFQEAYDLAQKHGINLRLTQDPNGSNFVKLLSSTTGDLPGSGAAAVKHEQVGAWNDALGRRIGIPDAGGKLNTDLATNAFDEVGNRIGDVAKAYNAKVTPSVDGRFQDILQHAQDYGDKDIFEKVDYKIGQLLQHQDANGEIPGEAWKQANTALGSQARTESNSTLRGYYKQLYRTYLDMMHDSLPAGPVADDFKLARQQYRDLITANPLIEKAGSAMTDTAVNPNLLQARNISSKNNRGDMQELGDLGKKYLTSHTPDSKTAQRHMILMGTQMLGGGLLGAGAMHHQGDDPALMGAKALAGIGLGVAGHRALNSKWLARVAASQAPNWIKQPFNAVVKDNLPGATASMGLIDRADAQPELEHRAEQSMEGAQSLKEGLMEHFQSGGKVRKTLWDLVKK